MTIKQLSWRNIIRQVGSDLPVTRVIMPVETTVNKPNRFIGILLGDQAGKVLLRCKDYRDGKNKVLKLAPEELIRRFLLYVLPRGLMRIQHLTL